MPFNLEDILARNKREFGTVADAIAEGMQYLREKRNQAFPNYRSWLKEEQRPVSEGMLQGAVPNFSEGMLQGGVPIGSPALPSPVVSPRSQARPALAPRAAPPETMPLSPMEFQGMPPEPETIPLSPTEFQGMPPATAPAPAAPRQSYVDMIKEIMAQKQEPLKGDLSDEQRRNLQLQFFLSGMAHSAKPGAYALGAAGQAGQEMLAAQRAMENENLTRAERGRANQWDTAIKLANARNLDEDNLRLDRQEATTEKYRAAQESRFAAQERRLDAQTEQGNKQIALKEKELEQQGKRVTGHVVLGNGNIGLYTSDLNNPVKDSGQKAKDKPERNAQIEFYSWLAKNPEAKNLFLREKGPQPMNDKDAMSIASKLMDQQSPLPGETPMQQLQRLTAGVVDASRGSRGQPEPGTTRSPGAIKRSDQKYLEALRDPRIGGDKKKLDAMLSGRGMAITD